MAPRSPKCEMRAARSDGMLGPRPLMKLQGGVGMRSKSFLTAVFVAVLAMPAIAQNPPASPPARIRGTVEKLDGQVLTVKSRDGQPVTVTLAPNVTVAYLVKKSLADIKAGDF